jgi:hypothetical protein
MKRSNILLVTLLILNCLLIISFCRLYNYAGYPGNVAITKEYTKPSGQYKRFTSKELKKIQDEFQFSSVSNIPEELAGLNQEFQVAVGLINGNDSAINKEYGQKIQYVVVKNGKFKCLKSFRDFTQVFTPIETEEQAFSFVIALTTSFPLYHFELSSSNIFTDTLKKSIAVRAKNGYFVYLYTHQVMGCGHHPHYLMTYFVTNSGILKLISEVKVFEDIDYSCVD